MTTPNNPPTSPTHNKTLSWLSNIPPAPIPSTNPPLEIIFVLGPPGAGKGTLCPRLAHDLDYTHLSTGDYLRTLSTSPTAPPEALGGMTQAQLRSDLQARRLVPVETIVSILAHKIAELGVSKVILDGYPRQIEAARVFEEKIGYPVAILDFRCEKAVAKQRFLDRRRGDDDAAVFEGRWREFELYHRDVMVRYHFHAEGLDEDGVSPREAGGTVPELREVFTGVDGVEETYAQLVRTVGLMWVGRGKEVQDLVRRCAGEDP